MHNANYLKKGCWNVICMVCSFKYKSDKIRRRWDNLLVCPKCFELRHPQDFLKAVEDKQEVVFSNPRAPIVYLPD